MSIPLFFFFLWGINKRNLSFILLYFKTQAPFTEYLTFRPGEALQEFTSRNKITSYGKTYKAYTKKKRHI